jgi:carbamoyltransferase
VLILGFNAYHGDVSAAILRDGVLLFAVEEERFRRVKHWAGFPERAIAACLQRAGASLADVDLIAVPRLPRAHLGAKARFALTHWPGLSLFRAHDAAAKRRQGLAERLADTFHTPAAAVHAKLRYVEHHPAHLASAFYASAFEEAAVCAIDGFGDFVSTSRAAGRGTRIDVLERTWFPHSLGLLYTGITQHLGFKQYGDEFKVMGLAPYGRPTMIDRVRRLLRLEDAGAFTLDLRYFRHWRGEVPMTWDEGAPELGDVLSDDAHAILGPPRQPGEPLGSYHENLAASLQAAFEEAAFHVLRSLHQQVPLDNLCLAGGCAMNSVANGKISRHTPFRHVYIQPAAADNGTAVGAALEVWHRRGGARTPPMRHAYWGTEYPASEIAAALGRFEYEAHRFRIHTFEAECARCTVTARYLADGGIVGWFQGRMELGARALGNRSILADPRRADMRETINTKIKFRERFRPFAPAILEEHVHDYFEDAATDPFMLQVFPIRAEKRAAVPAVTHVDGSGRLQTVSAASNPLFAMLIRAFADVTGVPVLLNTSFNENEPIVERPEQAIDCFLRTDMDALVIGPYFVEKTEPSLAAAGRPRLRA